MLTTKKLFELSINKLRKFETCIYSFFTDLYLHKLNSIYKLCFCQIVYVQEKNQLIIL